MRPPKHIRDAKAQRKAAALQSYHEAKASGTLERSNYSSYGARHGYAMSPDANLGYRFHQPMNAKGSRLKGMPKSILKDADLYKVKLDVTGGSRAECKVRIGTTPSRGIIMLDKETGEEKYVKLKSKPKFQNVGEVTCYPKDGESSKTIAQLQKLGGHK